MGPIYYSSTHPHGGYQNCLNCGTPYSTGTIDPYHWESCSSCYEYYVPIMCQVDTAYTEIYGDTYMLEMSDTMSNINNPFFRKWGITFDRVISRVYELPLDSCNCSRFSICLNDDDHHSDDCHNGYGDDPTVLPQHFRNIYWNLQYVKNNYPLGSYELMLTATGKNCCRIKEGLHNANVKGIGELDGNYTFVELTGSMLVNVRLIQHEISHNYSCEDTNNPPYSCTPGQNCIFNGGFDNNSNYNIDTIWCDACAIRFQSNLH